MKCFVGFDEVIYLKNKVLFTLFILFIATVIVPPFFTNRRTLYAYDGRKINVREKKVEYYISMGWKENLSDVTVEMTDANGNTETVFLDNTPEMLEKGYKYVVNDSVQMMFSDDGRVIYVPLSQISAYMNVGWYCGSGKLDPSKPMVALTFDDGPSKFTETILNCLEKYNVRATFFVLGQNAPKYPDTIRHAVSIGCEIGNHTQDHINLVKATSEQMLSQINGTNNTVSEITGGVSPALYRPPYGSYDSTVLSTIPMPAIMWSVDTLDWKTRNTQSTVDTIMANVSDGSIVLMHDIYEPTAEAALQIVPYLLKQGYQLVTVSELLESRKGEKQSGKVYNSAN